MRISNGLEITHDIWFTSISTAPRTMGVVLGNSGHGDKAYIGLAPGEDHDSDVDWVGCWGSPFPLEVAYKLFGIKEKPIIEPLGEPSRIAPLLAHAAELLEQDAEALKESSTTNDGQWRKESTTDEVDHEAKRAYDDLIITADNLIRIISPHPNMVNSALNLLTNAGARTINIDFGGDYKVAWSAPNTTINLQGREMFNKFKETSAPAKAEDDLSRCAICGWPLVDSQEKGCMRGDCSMRPAPERFYSEERAYKEYGNRLRPKKGP